MVSEEHERATCSGKAARSLEPTDPYYVPLLEGNGERDPILKLQQRILWAESQSVDLLIGFRGNGKSTQLKRLKAALEKAGCHVVLVDMTEHILMTKGLEISDFILSLIVALAVEVKKQDSRVTEIFRERLADIYRALGAPYWLDISNDSGEAWQTARR